MDNEHGLVVTQAELSEIIEHEREIQWRTKRANELRESVRALLHGGAQVENGRFGASLAKRIGRAVPWKRLFVEHVGEDEAKELKRQFKVHLYFELVVQEYAVPPLWRGQDDAFESGL